MSSLTADHPDELYQRIRAVLAEARARAWRAVNWGMVACYWEIGRLIIEHEQSGEMRAGYGKRLLSELSTRLSDEFGRGYDRTNLQHMRAFYSSYPIRDALRRELIGIILCTDKSEAVVRYTLPEGNQQIFASRYKLYLPTEEELAAELVRERELIERERRLSVPSGKE